MKKIYLFVAAMCVTLLVADISEAQCGRGRGLFGRRQASQASGCGGSQQQHQQYYQPQYRYGAPMQCGPNGCAIVRPASATPTIQYAATPRPVTSRPFIASR